MDTSRPHSARSRGLSWARSIWLGNVLANGAVAAALADLVVSPLPPRVAGPCMRRSSSSPRHRRARQRQGRCARREARRRDGGVEVGSTRGFCGCRRICASTGPTSLRRGAERRGLGRALILAVFALMGWSPRLLRAVRSSDPHATFRAPLAITVVSVSLLYIAIQAGCAGNSGARAGAFAGAAVGCDGTSHPFMRLLMLACGALSMFGWLSSDILGSPRIAFAFARDGCCQASSGGFTGAITRPTSPSSSTPRSRSDSRWPGSFAELAVLSAPDRNRALHRRLPGCLGTRASRCRACG